MKKLLIAVTAAMLGIVANAASYNWKANNDGYSPDGENPLEGTVYLFDGTANTIDAITGALSDPATLALALDSVALAEGAFMMEGTGLDADGSEIAHMFAVVINDAGDGYWASDMVDVPINDAIKGGAAANFGFGENYEVTFTPISGPTPPTPPVVPEPTSGLLLLLGAAGLALRRKQA